MKNLSFGDALEAINAGCCMQRSGWNGKGMFVFQTTGRTIPLEEFGKFKNGNSDAIELARELGTHTGNEVVICPHIDMLAADGSIVVGWLASQTDMQANDWQIVHPKGTWLKTIEDAEHSAHNQSGWDGA